MQLMTDMQKVRFRALLNEVEAHRSGAPCAVGSEQERRRRLKVDDPERYEQMLAYTREYKRRTARNAVD